MSNSIIRVMEIAEFKKIYARIEQDFPPGEYAPYEILYQQVQSGALEALIYCDGSKDLAYAICAVNNIEGYVLISLLAVFPESRGNGIGSDFLKDLGKKYVNSQAIVVEVERPYLAQTPQDQEACQRRISFYEKVGYYLIPEIDYTIWDVPMHLMALPILTTKEQVNQDICHIMHQIYYPLLGEQFIHRVSFV